MTLGVGRSDEKRKRRVSHSVLKTKGELPIQKELHRKRRVDHKRMKGRDLRNPPGRAGSGEMTAERGSVNKTGMVGNS